jgi:hypothetical protein
MTIGNSMKVDNLMKGFGTFPHHKVTFLKKNFKDEEYDSIKY